MVAHALDRQAPISGARVVSGTPTAAGGAEALLALADGSVWSVRRTDSAAAVTGSVRVVGARVLVGGSEVASLSDPEAARIAHHLSETTDPGVHGGPHGCVSAAGATTPVHRAVALAVARGEIGRPW
jgi:hypothetical protein